MHKYKISIIKTVKMTNSHLSTNKISVRILTGNKMGKNKEKLVFIYNKWECTMTFQLENYIKSAV